MNKKDSSKDEQKAKSKLLLIRADLQSIRLSHILSMKTLFEKNRGETPIQIEFQSNGKGHAVLHIDSSWGVHTRDDLQQQIRALPAILHVEIQ